MKTIFALLCALAVVTLNASAQGLNSQISAANPKAPQFKWVPLTTGSAVAASSTNDQFTSATFYGYKFATNNAAPTANSAAAYVGYTDTPGNVTTANTPAIVDTISAGSWLGVTMVGTKYDLQQFYFVGSTGDKVLIVYEK